MATVLTGKGSSCGIGSGGGAGVETLVAVPGVGTMGGLLDDAGVIGVKIDLSLSRAGVLAGVVGDLRILLGVAATVLWTT